MLLRYCVAACASAVLVVASAFLSGVGPIWP
jgi:hypothetical protein